MRDEPHGRTQSRPHPDPRTLSPLDPLRHLHRILVLHGLVSPHFLRQESGCGICLEHHGTRRQVGPEREFLPKFSLILLTALLPSWVFVRDPAITTSPSAHRRLPQIVMETDGRLFPRNRSAAECSFGSSSIWMHVLYVTRPFFSLVLTTLFFPRHYPSDARLRYA